MVMEPPPAPPRGTEDSLEAILAEARAAADEAERELGRAPAAPPPPAPLRPWCGACELSGDALCMNAGCAVANGAVAFYDGDEAAAAPALSVDVLDVAASYALVDGAVSFRVDGLAYAARFEDNEDVAGFCRAVAATGATRIFELRASTDARAVRREDLVQVAVKAYRGDALVLDDPAAVCAADGSVEPVPGLGATLLGARRGSKRGVVLGDRWVEADILHIGGDALPADPPLLPREVVEKCVVTPPPKAPRKVSLAAAHRKLDDLLEAPEEAEDPRVAELIAENGALRAKVSDNEDALRSLRAFLDDLRAPRSAAPPSLRPAARAWKAVLDAEFATIKASMATQLATNSARSVAIIAARPEPDKPRECPYPGESVADTLLRSIAFDVEVLEKRASAADHARYLDGLRAVLAQEEGRVI